MPFLARPSFCLLIVLELVVQGGFAAAQNPDPGQIPLGVDSTAQPQQANGDSAAALLDLISAVVRDHIPHTHEDLSKWGLTSERWDGLHLQLDRFRLKTKRRKKQVNHGDWEMYRISLLDPDHQLDVRVENVMPQEDGRIGFDTIFSARVHAFGRVSKWIKGVQLYSFSADATATLTLQIHGSVALALNVTKLPPDVVLDPRISEAQIRLEQFRLIRISDVGGRVAEQLGRGVKRILDDKIADRNHQLASKLNRQIDKKRDRLRLSIHDLAASQYAKWIEYAKEPDAATAAETAATRVDE